MELTHITYQGPAVDDEEMLDRLPDSLRSILTSVNGFIQFGGALHMRGACFGPDWHSLRRAWDGPGALHHLFPSVSRDWVPFAEDCVGDQFLLEGDVVLRLSAEIGDIERMELSLPDFMKAAATDPVEFLSMHPLLQYLNQETKLPEGALVHAYPPFCSKESADGVSLRAVPAWELHGFHSQMARTLSGDA
ncbi:hypothetical protein AAD018_014380 [Aestuariibius insulae]|uniref:hypothetical protein n=1 Tax=Aestuariibius insulae TaxID=2058287 RepID=UPI00345E24B4